jgi:Short C-terminal domain
MRCNTRRGITRLASLSVIILTSACSISCVTIAGNQLTDIKPTPPSIPPRIEETVGDFSFHLDGGKMITSNRQGRTLNQELLKRWEARGWIAHHQYVKRSAFTGTADYNLILSGHQEGESSVFMQVLSGLTLLVVPYWVTEKMDLRYTLEHVRTGRTFEATASDSYSAVSQLFLLPVTLFAMGGAKHTYDRLASHLYEQLSSQGAFDPDSWEEQNAPDGDKAQGSPSERLLQLQRLREKGLISDEEYEQKKREILDAL